MLEHPNSIEKIDISFNNLTRVPPSMSMFKNLKTIDLSNNQLDSVPQTILHDLTNNENLKNLELLDLRNNPLNQERLKDLYSKYPHLQSKILH